MHERSYHYSKTIKNNKALEREECELSTSTSAVKTKKEPKKKQGSKSKNKGGRKSLKQMIAETSAEVEIQDKRRVSDKTVS